MIDKCVDPGTKRKTILQKMLVGKKNFFSYTMLSVYEKCTSNKESRELVARGPPQFKVLRP